MERYGGQEAEHDEQNAYRMGGAAQLGPEQPSYRHHGRPYFLRAKDD
jgi:hypothetical protein